MASQAGGGSFLSKAGPLVVARFITAILTTAIPLVLARWMSLENYGTYKQIFLLVGTAYLLVPFGMVQGLYFFIPRAEKKRPLYFNALIWVLIGGAVMALTMAATTDWMARYFSNPELVQFRWPIALYAMLLIAALPLEIGLTSQGNTKASAISYLFSDTLRAASMVLPVLLGHGLVGVMHSLVVFMLLRTCVCWAVLLWKSEGPLFSATLFKEQLVYAAPFGAAMLLAVPQQYAHQYAVSGIVSPELFAIYSVGCFQLPIVELLYTPTSEVLMVQIGTLEKNQRLHEAVECFREAAAKLSLAFFPMAAFLFAAAPEFIAALFGQKFMGAVPIFRVSVIGVLFAVLPMDGVLRARNDTRHIFLSYLVKAVATVPLVWLGVKHFGMLGGIGSWAIAEAIGKATLLVRVPAALSSPERKLTIHEVIPWRDFGKASLSAAAAGLGVFALRYASAHAWGTLPNGFIWRAMPLLAAGLLFMAGYLATLRITGVRPLSVLSSLRKRQPAQA